MKISVVIPTYNRAHTLTRCITSVLKQSILPDEIIIVDDGSFDDTSEVLKNFDGDIRYICQKNSGVSSARNRGIESAKYDWICFLDSDDTWHQNKIEKQIEFHKKYPNILFSHTSEMWIRNNQIKKYPKSLKKPSGYCFESNLSRCKIAASSVMIHKSIFEDIGSFDESFRVCEDYDMWLRISADYEIGLIGEELITKYGGELDQLSNTITMIDRYHITSMKKFIDTKYSKEVKNQIQRKYNILIKGALKHGNKDILEEYSEVVKMLDCGF